MRQARTSRDGRSTNDGQDIVVTGSRLRGAAIASPVVRIGQEDIRDSGQAGLGDVVRRIPQSFGGGQNPGIGMNVPDASGVDVGGGSSINLRGLGSDATLTLLNGRRLAYTAVRQSVDVSGIPVSAVDRIEVVPDGASAIYGSDAVAGVANIILRRVRRMAVISSSNMARSSGAHGRQAGCSPPMNMAATLRSARASGPTPRHAPRGSIFTRRCAITASLPAGTRTWAAA